MRIMRVIKKRDFFPEFLCLLPRHKKKIDQKELQIKMSSVMPFAFNAVELYAVSNNDKLWARAREVCEALKHNKKTGDIVKNHCSKENYVQKHHVHGARWCTCCMYTNQLAKGFGKIRYLYQ